MPTSRHAQLHPSIHTRGPDGSDDATSRHEPVLHAEPVVSAATESGPREAPGAVEPRGHAAVSDVHELAGGVHPRDRTHSLEELGLPPNAPPPMRAFRRGPWPQPSPWFPNHMIPAVLHVPEDVQQDWLRHVKSRYVRQLVRETGSAIVWALRNPGLLPISDVRFVELTTDGIVGRLVTPTLDPADDVLFARELARGPSTPDATFYKGDYRIMELVAPDAESEAAPCVALFERTRQGRYALVAIAVADVVFTPGDGSAWELAKHFALQAAGVSTTLHMHPRLHFPNDPVDAIARTILPDGHPVKELLRPHLRLELGVSDAVLHGPKSVLRPGHIYSPYPGTHEENLRLVSTIWTGHPHSDGTVNSAFPPFEFPLRPKKVHSPYGVFLDRYFDVVRDFVAAVLSTVDPRDPDLVDFANHVNGFLPGFPCGRGSVHPDALASALATVIFNVSIAHSADHYLYGQVDPREISFRLKVQRPVRGRANRLDRSTMVSTRDLVAATMCSRMYFQPHVIERLVDARYRFDARELAYAVHHFKNDLRDAEMQMRRDGVPIYVPLDEIATSVQF